MGGKSGKLTNTEQGGGVKHPVPPTAGGGRSFAGTSPLTKRLRDEPGGKDELKASTQQVESANENETKGHIPAPVASATPRRESSLDLERRYEAAKNAPTRDVTLLKNLKEQLDLKKKIDDFEAADDWANSEGLRKKLSLLADCEPKNESTETPSSVAAAIVTAIPAAVAGAVDAADNMVSALADSTTKVGADGAIEDTYEPNKLLGLVLRSEASAILGDAIGVVKDVLPYARGAISAIECIYELVRSSKMIVREAQEFVRFVQVIEGAVCRAAKLFKTEEAFLEDLARKLGEAKKLVESCTKRKNKWSRFWHSKGDRAALVNAQKELRETMNDAQFTMLVDQQEAATMRQALDDARITTGGEAAAAADALREKIMAKVGDVKDEVVALRLVMAAENEDMKREVLATLRMQESELKESLEGLARSVGYVKDAVDDVKDIVKGIAQRDEQQRFADENRRLKELDRYPIRSSSMPQRNAHYTGNDDVIEKLYKGFAHELTGGSGDDESKGDSKSDQLSAHLLVGLGGVGKSGTVVECIHRHFDELFQETGALWVSADTTATLEADFRKLAVDDMGLAHLADEKSAPAVRAAVFKVLRERTGWILVYDNADNPEVLQEWLPSADIKGCVLLTSRARAESFYRANIKMQFCEVILSTLDVERSEELLWKHCMARREGTLPSARSTAELRKAIEAIGEAKERDALRWFASGDGLGGLPLALEQVGAYVGTKNGDMAFAEYTQTFREAALGALEEKETWLASVLEEFDLQEYQGVIVEWGVKKPADLAKIKAEQLAKWGFSGLQKETFREAVERVKSIRQKKTIQTIWEANFKTLAANAPAAMELLQLASVMHPERIPRELAQRAWQTVVGMAVAGESATDKVMVGLCSRFDKCRGSSGDGPLSADVDAVSGSIIGNLSDLSEVVEVAIGVVLGDLQRYSLVGVNEDGTFDVHRLLQQVVRDGLAEGAGSSSAGGGGGGGSKKSVGARGQMHKEDIVRVAVGVCSSMLKASWREAWAQDKKRWVVWQAHGAAVLGFAEQSEFKGKVGVLALRLGRGARELGEVNRALEMLECSRAVLGQTSVVGNESLDYSEVLHYLAGVYRAKGKIDEAMVMLGECLVIKERLVGKENSGYALALFKMGSAYGIKGDLNKALELYTQCVAIQEKTIGRKSSEYADTLGGMASVYWKKGNLDRALEIYEECRVIEEKTIGKESPWYANTLACIAGVYKSKGNLGRALEMYEECRVIEEKTIGTESPGYAGTLACIAGVYLSKGDLGRALEMYEECRVIEEKTIGTESPGYAGTLDRIATVYQYKGDLDRALGLFEECRVIREKTIGKESPGYAATLNNIAMVYDDKGDLDRALEMYEECRVIKEKTIGKESPDYATTLWNMADANENKGNLDRALEMYEECRVIYGKSLGEDSSNYRRILKATERVKTQLNCN